MIKTKIFGLHTNTLSVKMTLIQTYQYTKSIQKKTQIQFYSIRRTQIKKMQSRFAFTDTLYFHYFI